MKLSNYTKHTIAAQVVLLSTMTSVFARGDNPVVGSLPSPVAKTTIGNQISELFNAIFGWLGSLLTIAIA